MKLILAYFNVVLILPAYFLYRTVLNEEGRLAVREDISRNCKERDHISINSVLIGLSYCILHFRQFRNIFSYRINRSSKLWAKFFNAIYSPLKDIELSGEIGGGLVIWHGYGLVCVCNSIGRNCTLYQGVTIGRNPNGTSIDTPTIGDNVYVYSNAIVAGDIVIGNNVTIGAGSVVLKSVESNSVVAGNPAKRIK